MDKIDKEANPTSGEINELLFADDQILIPKDSAGLQDHTNKLNAACEKYGMKVSIAKGYGGPLLTHSAIPMDTKAKLINAIFFPTLCYQCQTWTLNKRTTQKLITGEMRCLRRAANKSRRDKIRNEDIRKMVGTTPITEYVAKQQVRWFGHLVRMAPSQPTARTYNSKTTGTRARGRPRKRWADEVKEVMGLPGVRLPDSPRKESYISPRRYERQKWWIKVAFCGKTSTAGGSRPRTIGLFLLEL
ncbi:uncharacterized protein [Amphiura filiformis]|uniref:uncharacterized protein n=1 Tax=Amphiura filiformis TaxID=82378 RepID=UPI003B21630A